MNVGDLVMNTVGADRETGLVLRTGVDVWMPEDGFRSRSGPEVGATVLWSDGCVELQYEEDLEVIA